MRAVGFAPAPTLAGKDKKVETGAKEEKPKAEEGDAVAVARPLPPGPPQGARAKGPPPPGPPPTHL